MSSTDKDRVDRERQYHDERYTIETRTRASKYYNAGDPGMRCYNDLVGSIRPGRRVLEYGCGTGSSAFRLAERGCEVVGIDISGVAIAEARAEAERRGIADRCTFIEMNAEHLELPPLSFDVVCGSGVLHHVDLERAFPSLAAVLRPDGRAFFYEPMGHNPVINLYRRLTPSMRTPDEHPLRMSDFAEARRSFVHVETSFFSLFAIGGAFLRRLPGGRLVSRALARLDAMLFKAVPMARRWAWIVVVELRLPLPAAR